MTQVSSKLLIFVCIIYDVSVRPVWKLLTELKIADNCVYFIYDQSVARYTNDGKMCWTFNPSRATREMDKSLLAVKHLVKAGRGDSLDDGI